MSGGVATGVGAEIAVVGAEAEIVERLRALAGGFVPDRKGGAEREAAVSHGGANFETIDPGGSADEAVDFDVGRDAAGVGEGAATGGFGEDGEEARDEDFEGLLGLAAERLARGAPDEIGDGAAHPERRDGAAQDGEAAGVGGEGEPAEEGVFFGRGVDGVGSERHDLALVFERTHLELVGDVFEEEAEGGGAGEREDFFEGVGGVGPKPDGAGFAVADAVERDDGGVGVPVWRIHRGSGVGFVVVDEEDVVELGAELSREGAAGPGAEKRVGGELGEGVFRVGFERVERSGRDETATQLVIIFLHRRKRAREGFREIGGGWGPSDAAIAGGTAHGGEGAGGEADVELAAAEAFLVEGEFDAAVDDESGAGVVAVPHADDCFVGTAHD